jgi:hypothetical protein
VWWENEWSRLFTRSYHVGYNAELSPGASEQRLMLSAKP